MFAVTVSFQIHSDQIGAFMPLMIANARASREHEPGCHQFDVCQDADGVFLYEVYDDRAAFDAHLNSDHFKAFDRTVAPMIAGKNVRMFEKVIR